MLQMAVNKHVYCNEFIHVSDDLFKFYGLPCILTAPGFNSQTVGNDGKCH